MDSLFSITSFVFGAIVGSFLNVVILRLPTEGESIVFPPSRCPSCRTEIKWYDNIPILSFVFLRGKCRACRQSISIQYPMVEFCMAILSMALYTKFALSFEFFFYFIFVAALLAVIFIDIHHQIIPDVISLPGIILGFAGSFLNSQITWQQSALGILFGGGVLLAVAWGYYLFSGREGMGGGDIKLLGMIGAFLGYQSLLFIIFASSLSGSFVGIIAMIKQGKGGKSRIPFGPFLALAAFCFLFFQNDIFSLWQWYLTLGTTLP